MWIVLLLMDNSFIYKKSRNCLTTTTKRMWSFWCLYWSVFELVLILKCTGIILVNVLALQAAQAVLAGGMIRQYWCLYWLYYCKYWKWCCMSWSVLVLVLDLLLVCIWAWIDLHWNVLGSVLASVLAHLRCACIFNSFDGALPSEREKQSWFDWTIEISPFIGWALLGQFSARRSPFQVSHHIANCVRRSLTSYTLQPARSPLPHAALAPDH